MPPRDDPAPEHTSSEHVTAEQTAPEQAASSTDSAIGTATVAIIDDHAILRGPLGDALVAARPGLRVVYSGDDAAEVLRIAPTPDLVLLDLNLHGKPPSNEAVAGLASKGARIIILSAMQEPDTVRSMVRLGVLGFVSKEANQSELLVAVDAALAGDPIMNATIASALTAGSSLNNPPLTDKEQQVLILFAGGLKISVVARRLGISPNTVKTHLKRIREKHLQVGRPVPTQTHMLREATRRGLVT